MPTEEERREKARSLRDLCGRDYGEAGVPIDDIERALGVEPVLPGSYDPDDVDTLAGLIDQGPERTCHVITTNRKVSQTQTIVSKSCSCCGHVFGSEEHRPLLPGLDEEIVLGEVRIPNYCDECGAKVVEK